MAAGVKGVVITAKVKSALAADDELSAIGINVDTRQGRVVLEGTAPDHKSKARAASLAAAVDGVMSVANRLTIEPRR